MTPEPPRIATAGWSVPAAHAERFAGPGSHLERYARVMDAVEINTSFYRPHRRATYERWAAATPAHFRFSVKTPKLLTHEQRLAAPFDALDRFADEIAGLGEKLGVVLAQTPPSLAFDPARAATFFDAMRARIAAPVAFEPRHASWFTPEADAFLAARRIARVAADPAKPQGAGAPGGWRGLSYLRLHGGPKMYFSAYTPEFLARAAAQVRALAGGGPVWCVFDNTAEFAALGDALTLRALLDAAPADS